MDVDAEQSPDSHAPDHAERTEETGFTLYRVVAKNGLDWTSNEMGLHAGGDTTPPQLVSGETVGRIITLTYDEVLDHSSVPDKSRFSISGSGTIERVAPIKPGEREVKIITSTTWPDYFPLGRAVSYTAPTARGETGIQDLAGNRAASRGDIETENATPQAPTLAHPLEDQTTEARRPFTYQIRGDTFVRATGAGGLHLTYSATRADGTALPEWLSFDATAQTAGARRPIFSGTPQSADRGTVSIKVTATQSGITQTASDTFDISVVRRSDDPPAIGPGSRIIDVRFSEPEDGYYWTAGEELEMHVQFNNPVTVTALNAGGITGDTILLTSAPVMSSTVPGGKSGNVCGEGVLAGVRSIGAFVYKSGSGTDTLVFACPVAAGPFTRIEIPPNNITVKDWGTEVRWTSKLVARRTRAPHPAYAQTSAGDGQRGPSPVAVLIEKGAGADGYWSPGGTGIGYDRRVEMSREWTFEADNPEIVVRFSEAVTAKEAGPEGKLWLVAQLDGRIGSFSRGKLNIAFAYDEAKTTARGIGTDLVFTPMPYTSGIGLWSEAITWTTEFADLFQLSGTELSVPRNALRLHLPTDGYVEPDGSAAIRGAGSKLIASLDNPSARRSGFSVCGRTPQVAEALRATAGVASCDLVTTAQLSAMTILSIANTGTAALKAGDFDGLTSLADLYLSNNNLNVLPPGIFAGLANLNELWLNSNALTSLAPGIFDGLVELDILHLENNALESLPPGTFAGLAELDQLRLNGNDLEQLPPNIFAGLVDMEQVYLNDNALESLPPDVFDDLAELITLDLQRNDLRSLPDDVFEKLRDLKTLRLTENPDATNPVTFKPVANAGEDATVARGAAVTLAGTATGPWGDEGVSWNWTQVDGASSNTAVTGTGAVTLSEVTDKPNERTFTAGGDETLHFRLIATPVPAPGTRVTGVAASDADWVTITVGTGIPPTIPSITRVGFTRPSDGKWDPGEVAEARITFSEAVTVDTTDGTPYVTVTLGTGTGAVERRAPYASGSGTTTLVFQYTLASDEGPHAGGGSFGTDSVNLNGGTIESTAAQTTANLSHAEFLYTFGVGSDHRPGDGRPTATFSSAPTSHDGETAFEVRLTFSAEPSVTSYTTVRDHLVNVTGGRITRARRAVKGSNREWRLTVAPSGAGDVTLTLPVRACGPANAACIGGQPLASAARATIEGPLFTASFSNAPAEHDGSAFTVDFDLSTEPRPLSFRTVRDKLFTTIGGEITKAKRRTAGNDRAWRLTIMPAGYAQVRLALRPTTDCNTTPGVCSQAGRRLEGPLLLTVQGPPTLSVADAEVEEGEGAELRFVVELSRTVDETVTVDYATSEGSATAGVDYTKTAGTLTFNPGDTAHKVAVEVLDDAHDEGSETVTLTLSNATPARVKIADATATGTITNTDPMPKAWMVRFGRTVGTHVVDALDARLTTGGGSSITVGGVTLGRGATPAEADEDDPFAMPAWTRTAREEEIRTPSGQELLLGTRFHLESAGEGGGPAFAAWGRVARSGFEGEEADVSFDGDVTSGLIGFDAQWERALAGVMLSHSEGDGAYALSEERGGDEGTVESTMSGIYPYASLELDRDVSVWGLAGAGSGELTLVQRGERAMPTDLSMRMAAGGVRGRVLDEADSGAMTMVVKADAMWVGMKSADTEELAATQGDVTRLRLTLEGQRTFETTGGGALTPIGELGLRRDGGDAETGTGLELGAGLAYTHGALSIEGRMRTLLAHEDSGYEEWGASGTVRVAPDAHGRGFTLSVRPEWGATASATERLWAARDARELAGEPEYTPGQRLAVDTGYGFGAAGGVLTPFAGMTFESEAGRTMRSGATWRLGNGIALKLEASRSEYRADADSALMLTGGIRF